ncbi:MAG: glycosyltransferase family 39 protein [Armatimonadia bacterium]
MGRSIATSEANAPLSWVDPDLQPTRHAVRINLLAAGLLLACLLVCDLGGRELWTDEEFSLAAGGDNLHHAMFGDASHPPGYPLLLHFWLRAGTAPDGHVSDGWLRAFSIPWALLTWALGWLIAFRLGLRREGLLAAWLMAFSPLVVMYFRLGRYYSMTAALTMLAVYLALLVLSRPVWWRALLLALAIAALGYTDFLGLQIALAALALYGLMLLVRRDYRTLGYVAGSAAFALIPLIPLIIMVRAKAAVVAQIQSDPLAGSLWGTLVKLALPVFSLATGEAIDPWRFGLTIPAVLITTVLLVAGLIYTHRRNAETALTLWLWPITIVLATLTMSTIGANVPPNRVTSFAMFTIPLAYLLLACGLTALCRPPRVAVVFLLVLVLVWGYGLSNYYQREQLLNPAFAPPWRQVGRIIAENDRPGDLIVSAENAFVRYYHGRAEVGHDPEFYGLAEGKVMFNRRIWLITRDRGSQEMITLSMSLRDRLLKHGFTEQIFPIRPRTPREQAMLTKILRRPAWDAYIKLYLFTPPAV